MDTVAQLGAEHVVDEPMLGQAPEAMEGLGGHDRVKVVPVAGDARGGSWDPRLDPFFKLFRRCGHALKGSETAALY